MRLGWRQQCPPGAVPSGCLVAIWVTVASLRPCAGPVIRVHVRQLGGVEASFGRRVPVGDPDAHAADRGGGRLEVDNVERTLLVAHGQNLHQQRLGPAAHSCSLARRLWVTARASRCWPPRRASGSRCGPGRGPSQAPRGGRGGQCRSRAPRSLGGCGVPRGRPGPTRRGSLLSTGNGRTARLTERLLRRRCHGSTSRGTRARRTASALRAGSGPVCHLSQAAAAEAGTPERTLRTRGDATTGSSSFQPIDR